MAARGVEGFVAVNRFGLGAKPGELDKASADPRGWLKAQLSGQATAPQALAGLPPSSEIIAALDKVRAQGAFGKFGKLGQSRAAMPINDAPANDSPNGDAAGAGAQRDALFAELGKRGRDLYLKEAAARTLAQIETDQPLRERLTVFWSNHFTVSIVRPIVLGVAGAFEREAIRPNVTGRFHDLLLAVVRHPAMLLISIMPVRPGRIRATASSRARG